MNKPVYLGLSILEISETLMYGSCYDYIKQKYQNNAKVCCMDTVSLIVHIQTKDVSKKVKNGSTNER